jgi:dTDP-4-amino-4,6-dideoxygalactose transaminase
LGSLGVYHEILEKRSRNLAEMMERLREFEPHLTTFRQEDHDRIGPHALPILVAENAPFTRDELVRHLEEAGIDTRNLFLSMPTQCAGFAFLGYEPGQFPEAEYVGTHGFHVGVHQDLGPQHVDYLMNTLRDFMTRHAHA